MSFAMTKSWHERYDSLKKHARVAAEKAKQGTHMVAGVGVGVVVAGGLGALDQAKGTIVDANDYNISQHRVGPVPTSALAGAGLAVVAMAMPFNSIEQKMVAGAAQGGLDAAAYVSGRRLWAKHAASNK